MTIRPVIDEIPGRKWISSYSRCKNPNLYSGATELGDFGLHP